MNLTLLFVLFLISLFYPPYKTGNKFIPAYYSKAIRFMQFYPTASTENSKVRTYWNALQASTLNIQKRGSSFHPNRVLNIF